jgi:hypothetical protein
MNNLDPQDTEILKYRESKLNETELPMVGDFIKYSDGKFARIAHIWKNNDGSVEDIQPTMWGIMGSFYLSEGYVSFSGGLKPSIKLEKFSKSNEKKSGEFWFFHHDYITRDNGVYASMNRPVWLCDKDSVTW